MTNNEKTPMTESQQMPELPLKSVVLDATGRSWTRVDKTEWLGGEYNCKTSAIEIIITFWGPITVLYRPDEDAVRVPRALLERLVASESWVAGDGNRSFGYVRPAEVQALLDGAV